jgi:hypothetical protein
MREARSRTTRSTASLSGKATRSRGCQNGRAIYVESASPVQATIARNAVLDYQKSGIEARGGDRRDRRQRRRRLGQRSVRNEQDRLERILVAYGACAVVEGNTVSGNWYTPAAWEACGVLFYRANGVKQKKNTFVANEVNLCNASRGGGKFNA